MSGVTVATIDQVDRPRPRRPACSSACSRGRQREVGERLARARRRGARGCPVRSTIHSSEVSTSFASSSFVTTRSGTWQPSPVIETACRSGRVPITSAPPRTSAFRGRRARRRPSPRACRGRSGPRTRSSSHVELSSSPGSTIRLKRTSSMPAKSASLPRFSSSREHRDRARLRQRLDHQHAGHDRAARESGPRRYHSSARTRLARDDALAGLELEHLVEQEERLAVREDLLDLRRGRAAAWVSAQAA